MKTGGAVGRRSGRWSFLGHAEAKIFAENGRELRTREKPRLVGPSRPYPLSIDRFPWRASGGGMNRAHRVGSRSRSCQSASQIILGIAMMAREIWTSQAEDSLHLSRRYVHGKQFSSEPQIDDAPVHLRKAFLNMPTLHPASINPRGSLRRHRALLADVQGSIDPLRGRSCGMLCDGLHGRTQQILGGTGQDGTSFDDFDPRSRTGSGTAFKLLISEARQSSQVAPVGTGQIASVGVSQLFTDDRGYGRLQECSADMNPSLEMARAGLEHHTRLMAMGSHLGQHIGRGVIQVEENIAGVAILGVGEKIDVKALQVACAQEAHYRSPHQLTNIPQSFAWARPSCGAMDQANEIELIRHRRQLAADCMRGDEESAIGHGHENAAEAPRAYNGFSLNGNNPLNSVSHSRGAPHYSPLLLACHLRGGIRRLLAARGTSPVVIV
jgi:hypothetical protein